MQLLGSRLPPELCDAIIDQISAIAHTNSRYRALAKCALVCHGWVARARHHLKRCNISTKGVKLCEGGYQKAKPLMFRYVLSVLTRILNTL